LLVQVNQDFRVALCGKSVAFRQQEVPNFGVVVNFPVEDHTNRAVFVGNGLVARGKVDDQPPHPDGAWAFGVETFIIWPAMAHLIAHRADLSKSGGLVSQQIPHDLAPI